MPMSTNSGVAMQTVIFTKLQADEFLEYIKPLTLQQATVLLREHYNINLMISTDLAMCLQEEDKYEY